MFKRFECGAFLACPLSWCCYLLLPVFNMLSPPVTHVHFYARLFRPALLPSLSLSLIDSRDIRNICLGSPDDRKCHFWLATTTMITICHGAKLNGREKRFKCWSLRLTLMDRKAQGCKMSDLTWCQLRIVFLPSKDSNQSMHHSTAIFIQGLVS